MAKLYYDVRRKEERRGFRGGSLPMPDGSRRWYAASGLDFMAKILERWQIDKMKMEVNMLISEYQG